MLIDITLKITPKMITDAQGNEKKALVGHLGTHFDVMNKEFPLEYTRRKGVVFDVSEVTDRDIDVCDIDLDKVESDMFVSFYTGFIEKIGYGGKVYFTEHPQLKDLFVRVFHRMQKHMQSERCLLVYDVPLDIGIGVDHRFVGFIGISR